MLCNHVAWDPQTLLMMVVESDNSPSTNYHVFLLQIVSYSWPWLYL